MENQDVVIEMLGMSKAPEALLINLRSTCQLVLLHPWFNCGSRLPIVDHRVPRSKVDLDCLLNNLSLVTEIVSLRQDHADAHRGAYAGMMALVVGTLNSAFAEPGLLKYLRLCDRCAMEQELSRLRLLVKNSWPAWTPVQGTAA